LSPGPSEAQLVPFEDYHCNGDVKRSSEVAADFVDANYSVSELLQRGEEVVDEITPLVRFPANRAWWGMLGASW